MLMVIFGAGASFDSCSTYPPGATLRSRDAADKYHRPPCANELFDDRPLFNNAIETFSQLKGIVPRLRAAAMLQGQTPVEVVLAEVETQANTYNRARVQLIAIRCYLQKIIAESVANWIANDRTAGITNQLALLQQIERTHHEGEPVLLVTFNYDILLEHALHQLGYPVATLDDYTRGLGFFKLFKLHGSVDWGRELPIPPPQDVDRNNGLSVLNSLIDNAAEPRETDRFVKCHPSQMGAVNELPVLPAIAIPIENKNTFECPASMLEDLKSVIPHVTKILIIGWQAKEAHFLRMLKSCRMDSLKHVMVVDRDRTSDELILNHFLEEIGKKYQASINKSWAEAGFSQLIRTNSAEGFLQA